VDDPEISLPFYFQPEKGQLKGFDRDGFKRLICGLNRGSYYYLSVKEWSPMRPSDQARGYYWGVVIEWWVWFWDGGRITKAEMHQILMDYSGIHSTADGNISAKEFITHIERCCDLFTKVTGGMIPPPERYKLQHVFESLETFKDKSGKFIYSADEQKPKIFELEGQAWTYQVQRMLERDENRCCVCGTRNHLTPHHIKSKGGLERGGDEITNLMTLCAPNCHRKYHDNTFDEHEYLLYLAAIRRIERQGASINEITV
jgi:hypothetical protein